MSSQSWTASARARAEGQHVLKRIVRVYGPGRAYSAGRGGVGVGRAWPVWASADPPLRGLPALDHHHHHV